MTPSAYTLTSPDEPRFTVTIAKIGDLPDTISPETAQWRATLETCAAGSALGLTGGGPTKEAAVKALAETLCSIGGRLFASIATIARTEREQSDKNRGAFYYTVTSVDGQKP